MAVDVSVDCTYAPGIHVENRDTRLCTRARARHKRCDEEDPETMSVRKRIQWVIS